MSTWNRIGHKRLLKKPASIMSISLDGKYLSLGSKDGDIFVVEVKKMEICHWSKRLHSGSCIESLEFSPSESFDPSLSHEEQEKRKRQAAEGAVFLQDLLVSTLLDD